MSGGTDNHIILIDLKETGISGSKMEKICEYVGISINKNSVSGDKSTLSCGGIRIGTCALTTRGLNKEDFQTIAEYFNKLIKISQKIIIELTVMYDDYLPNNKNNTTPLKRFTNKFIDNNDLTRMKHSITIFAKQFPFYTGF
jgi:glycine hydroxymethyltransferase